MPAVANVGDTLFTLGELRVAIFNSDGTWDTTSFALGAFSELNFSAQAENDMLKSGGVGIELLSVMTHGEGVIKKGSIDSEGLYVFTGSTTTSSGSTPNRTDTFDPAFGGAGLPYFGVIGKFYGLNGGGALVGLKKCKLDTLPPWQVEQNKFKMEEIAFKFVSPNPTTPRPLRVRKYETLPSIPTNFNLFFA